MRHFTAGASPPFFFYLYERTGSPPRRFLFRLGQLYPNKIQARSMGGRVLTNPELMRRSVAVLKKRRDAANFFLLHYSSRC